MSRYANLLKDPSWQRKRLEILQRDDWCCQSCFDGESTLHVHHRYYLRGHAPWNYPNEALVTLCEDCHSIETAALSESKDRLLIALSHHGLLASDFATLAAALEIAATSRPMPLLADRLAFALADQDCWAAVSVLFRRHIRRRATASRAEAANG